MKHKSEKMEVPSENIDVDPLNKETKETLGFQKELETAKREASENYSLYLRSVAESENIRKRLIKEVDQAKKFALESFCKEILTVLDGFDKAMQTENTMEGLDSFREGFSIVRKQLFEILERNGLQEISSVGSKFDPNLHQAIKRTESAEVSDEIIDCEYAKGYKMYDKLLRPAIVSVLVPSTNS